MKAYISNPDSGIRGMRPDLYTTDLAFLVAESQHEARRILSDTEPGSGDWPDYRTVIELGAYMRESLAEALAAFTAEPGK